MKKISILIPHYKEPENIVKTLLDSIQIQQGINIRDDLEIIIVNDGNDVVLSDEFLNKYDFDIKYVIKEHKGISNTRNKLLDLATSEYIMFCDCDDMFFSALAIFTIFTYIDDKDGFDVLVPKFKEENTNMWGKTIYTNRKEDRTFVHGKVYRRAYLIEKHIRFNEKIKINEDVCFNGIATAFAPRLKDVDNCYYLWRNNSNSVTRSTNDFDLDTIETLIICYYELIKEFVKRGAIKNARVNTTNALYIIYYESQMEKFIKNPDRLLSMEKEIKKLYLKYKYLYDMTTREEKKDLLKKIKVDFLDEILFERYTFESWLNHLEADIK